jgi:hypothetical protein
VSPPVCLFGFASLLEAPWRRKLAQLSSALPRHENWLSPEGHAPKKPRQYKLVHAHAWMLHKSTRESKSPALNGARVTLAAAPQLLTDLGRALVQNSSRLAGNSSA